MNINPFNVMPGINNGLNIDFMTNNMNNMNNIFCINDTVDLTQQGGGVNYESSLIDLYVNVNFTLRYQ